ncbi:hypothetical protein SAMN04488074_108240 [Lentzea albidocapillata subsp. violacea]|uniref:Scaffolding protein n=1 Tax=Lentzea albidocapillata subsp. violacea TaxID=128104 RepID=A0A1G9GKB3_9PSEU|nr:hypothetical protein [Lentzea albidocapillata]SDL01114.1 hypothetical protein SAMN04488074_108240 [Lentzea albidocapillata subsp. violacea]
MSQPTNSPATPAENPPNAPAQASAAPPVQPPAPVTEPPADTSTPDYKALYEQAQTKLAKAETTAREHRDKAKRLDEIEASQQSETERATARATAMEQQFATMRRTAVDAEIRAAATGWADPSDAPRYLDDRDRYLTEDGTVDTAAIAADLAAVLTQRPHLARVDGPRRPAPDPSQGQRNGPSGVAEQIRDAEARGDWATAISLKNQRLAAMAREQR